MAVATRPGIYEIVSPSGKRYVGSAANLRRRWYLHTSMLDRGVHHCKALQSAARKYGTSALTFNVLEFCDPEQLIQREQAHMDSAKKSTLYNSTLVAGSVLGLKLGPHKPETRELLSTLRRGKWLATAHRENVSKRNSSGFPGVSKVSRSTRWAASITYQGSRKYLGTFDTAELAAEARVNFLTAPASYVAPKYQRTAGHGRRISRALTGRGRSGYAGVSRYPRTGAWCAYTTAGGKQCHIGIFNAPEDAAAARLNLLVAQEAR